MSKTQPSTLAQMPPKQAITLGVLALDYWAETNRDAPDFAGEIQAARQTLSSLIDRPPAGEFFLTDPGRRRYQPPQK